VDAEHRPDGGGWAARTWDRYGPLILLSGLFLGVALGLHASWGRIDELGDEELPDRVAIGVAVLLLLAGQLSVGYAWRRLAPELRDPVSSMWTFHASQPGKYLPVGVGQVLGQVALVRGLGLSGRRAMGAWASHLSSIVAAGITTGVLLVLQPGVGPVRWAALACLGGLVFVHRPTLGRALALGARLSKRLPSPGDLPSQRLLVEAFAGCVGFVVLDGLAFAVLLVGDAGVAAVLAVVGGYALAVGISTATPLPAGIGVRELILVVVLTQSASATIAASVVLRVAVFAVEVSLVVVFSAWRRYRAIRAAQA
jgi:hypothetical protein